MTRKAYLIEKGRSYCCITSGGPLLCASILFLDFELIFHETRTMQVTLKPMSKSTWHCCFHAVF